MKLKKKKHRNNPVTDNAVDQDVARHFVLGESKWWIGLFILILIVFIFSKQFIPDVRTVIDDPLYLFSVIMTGIAIAAPILWILNEGKILLNRDRDEKTKTENELFQELISLPEDIYVFQSIKIGGERFENIAVGERSLTFITTITREALSSKKIFNMVIERAENKVKVLKEVLGNTVPVSFLLVKGKEGNCQETADIDDRRVVEIRDIKVRLRDLNSRGGILDHEVGERLKSLWNEGCASK